MDEQLTDKQRRYVQHIASGLESRQAARTAGYSDSFAKVAHYRLQKKPAVARAIAAIRQEGTKLAAYGLAEALAQAQEGIDFAKQNKSAMAFIQGCTLKSKLAGLLVDRVEVVTVDLKGALTEARGRVINVFNIMPRPRDESVPASKVLIAAQPASVPNPAETLAADGSARWKPFVNGD